MSAYAASSTFKANLELIGKSITKHLVVSTDAFCCATFNLVFSLSTLALSVSRSFFKLLILFSLFTVCTDRP